MVTTDVKTGEILFVKCVKDGIPNRDPLRDSDARRIFGEEDGRISLSDVSIKRDVRDYIQARFPDGGSNKNMGIFVRKEFTKDNKLLGRDNLAKTMLQRVGVDPKKAGQDEFMKVAFDARIFGVVFSVGGKAFNQCGPVQFGWAHSLHPVDTKYVQGTVVMPSKDIEVKEETGEETGVTQGTIWTTYTLPFAVFAMPAVINASIAAYTKMSAEDMEILIEALWKGTLARQARGRGIQQPLFLLHVEYKDPFFRLGFLEEGIKLNPGEEAWLGSQPPTSLSEITLDVTALASRLDDNKDKIHRLRLWLEPQLKIQGNLQAEISKWH
ncbi:MAG: type I CRISPR-associated protein Cas7 [Deltaproteobacteria bacterium]|nr:type I CRISPR-associated protein Cas7 [Deltaproteobacteria bacterium]